MAVNPFNNLNTVDTSKIGTSATKSGTPIRKPNQTMDKNAFLKILAAELSNQDPSKPTDNTAYVSQMAQFANIEQVANLNSNLRFTGAAALVGRKVMVNAVDEKGEPYQGIIKGISKNGDSVTVNVFVGQKTDSDGKVGPDIKPFKVEDILELVDTDLGNSGSSSSTTTK